MQTKTEYYMETFSSTNANLFTPESARGFGFYSIIDLVQENTDYNKEHIFYITDHFSFRGITWDVYYSDYSLEGALANAGCWDFPLEETT